MKRPGSHNHALHLAANEIATLRAENERLREFARWVAEHPDVGDSVTAAERERTFRARARVALKGDW